MPSLSVFISYRRDHGSVAARLFQGWLEQNGLEVFLDVDSLAAGHFDQQITNRIRGCDAVVVVLSQGSLNRCLESDDWLRREVREALEQARTLIPITLPGFSWDEAELPPDISNLRNHQALQYDHRHWLATRQELLRWLRPECDATKAIPDASAIVAILVWWNAVSVELMEAYLRRYPGGPCTRSAKEQISRLLEAGALRPAEAEGLDHLRKLRNQIVCERDSARMARVVREESMCFERLSDLLIEALRASWDGKGITSND